MKIREGETLRSFALRCALSNDTSMSRAFLRALGVPVPHRMRHGVIQRADRFGGAAERMGQRFVVRGL